MTAIAKPFRNKENYAKYLALYFEPGLTVLLTTLEWCYKGQRPIEEHLADLGATNFLRKTNTINATEQNTLGELKEGKTNLNALDITLLYKIIQLTCNLLPRNNEAWTKACPTPRQGELEFLLFQLKDGRNELAHPRDDQKNITDSMVEDKCKEMKDLLTKLLQAAALKANLDLNSSEFNKINKHCEDDVQRILKGENVCDSMSDHTLDLILTDLKARHFINDELKSTYLKEIEEYSAPSLNDKDGFHPLKDILQLNMSPVIVVQGEAGMGKTTMSRILFYAWLSGNADPVKELSSFDMVLRVDCNDIFSSDIHLFYETLLPSASFAFPNTNSLKRSLDKFKTLWIMDGFDESTAEFKGFLKAMANSLSEKHKLLITTRPNSYKDLKDILAKCKLSMTSLTLELLQDHNVKEIIQILITEDKKKETFKTHFHSLDETAKDLLRTPLNLNLYIKLWKQDPELVTNTFTTKMLFLKTIDTNLILLKERLYLRSSWSSKEDLKDFVNDWFYGSLCKQSFVMLMQGRYNTISTDDLVTWKKDARFSKLDPSTCLSSFLVQVKEYVEDEVENENYYDGEEWENVEENEGESENDDDVEEFENKEEDEGETSYKYVHLSQQFVLATLFLKHFKDYDGETVIKSSYNKCSKIAEIDASYNLVMFYVEMIKEDGSLNANLAQAFSPIEIMINEYGLNYPEHKLGFWFATSVASNFNVKYMENVALSLATNDILDLEIDRLFHHSILLNLTIFFKFVHPDKIIISDLLFTAWNKGFSALRDFLIKFKIQIMLKVYNDNFSKKYIEENGRIVTSESPQDMDTNLQSYIVSMSNKGELWINFGHLFYLTSCNRTPPLPKVNVEKTILRLYKIYKGNFEEALKILKKIKGEERSKFKALCHDYDNISETEKRQLLEISHEVFNDPFYQLKEFCIQEIVELNVTSFRGIMTTLDLFQTHHANIKTIFLHIFSEDDFCRMLAFLHENKTTLSEVSISLKGDYFYNFQHWERRSFFEEIKTSVNVFSNFLNWIWGFFDKTITSSNIFTFPQELVQHTTLSLGEINEDNFQDFFTLMNSVKGDKTLKFKACNYTKLKLYPDKRKMLEEMTSNLICQDDSSVFLEYYFSAQSNGKS